MWAVRRASVPLRTRGYNVRTSFIKLARTNCVEEESGITESHAITQGGLLLWNQRFHSEQSASLDFTVWRRGISSSSTKEDDDLEDGFSELDTPAEAENENDNLLDSDAESEIDNLLDSDADDGDKENVEEPHNEVDEVVKEEGKPRRGRVESELFNEIMNSPPGMSIDLVMDNWLAEGNELTRDEVSHAMLFLRRRKMFGRALQLSEWLESKKQVEFLERDYASRLDLIAKTRGLIKAEAYIETIPESCNREIMYRTLLFNCVGQNNVKKAEEVFSKLKHLDLPVTVFACNQMLLLYKRNNQKKIADVLLLMENENIKPSSLTYSILIDTKGQSKDIDGMDLIVDRMKTEGIELDIKTQAVLARHYISAGLQDKAVALLKEMEGGNLKQDRWLCQILLPLYANLGKVDEVERIWKVCETNPRYDECLVAIEAWGKLNKVDEAENVFETMVKRWKLSSKTSSVLLKVYANHKMITKGTTPPPSQPPLRSHTRRVRRGHNATWITAKMVVKPGSVPDFEALRELFKHHIESFDHMVDAGLDTTIRHIKAVEVFDDLTATKLRISLENPVMYPPQKERISRTMKEALLPFECRQAKISYTGKLTIDVCFQYNDGPVIRETLNFGQFPIMLQSKLCNLRGADPKKLVSYKEEASEMGGYFVLNGLERVIRLLIMPKRNYPTSMVRNSFSERREGYTDKAVVIRCVRADQSSLSIRLYYLRNGSARLGFWLRGREYLLPVGIVLKALIKTSDREIYVKLTSCYSEKYAKGKGVVGTQLVGERAKIILDELRDLSLFTQDQCLEYIGEHFQPIMPELKQASYSIVAEAVLKDCILVHLDENFDKFNLLIFMLQKLFSLIDQTSVPDNPDSLQNHEVLLPGHLITLYIKEKLEDWLQKGRRLIMDEIDKKSQKFDISDIAQVKKIMDKNSSKQVSAAVENMLKTGRLVTQTGLDLQQRAGYTVQAERLNFLRFISHFRSVHRGASFAGLRTTTVRKLLPESWGFLCPVHTPDGEPCGLLNHLTRTCRITSFFDSQGKIKDYFKIKKSIEDILKEVGMTPSVPNTPLPGPPEALTVLLDGCVIGCIASSEVEKVVAYIRELKVSSASVIPDDMEVGYVPLSMGGAYPGLYLSTSPSRFVRPVKNISIPSNGNENIELIGPFEQVFMEIRCLDGGDGGRKSSFPATHEEIHPTEMLSVVANLTPWSDHNQSPRNMYQCQMAKQTMAFSSQTIQHRADQKLYHLQTPQTPIVRTSTYSKYNIDEFPTGTNAIVAVLAYTGYDMEDAMILNKSSVERGMFHGQIYQTETIDLTEQSRKSDQSSRMFRKSNVEKSAHPSIDSDGLPHVGQMIRPDEPYCSIYNEVTSSTHTFKRKGSEAVYVDYVAVDVKNSKQLQKVNIRFRHPRNPVIGDKFSSRHGQKGVCSQLWPDVDMPFSGNTGMRPDLIINPHAFPSRMTIAMLLESVAAKGGSLRGEFVDATPFRSSVKKDDDEGSDSKSGSLVDDLGLILKEKGFNYHGLEVLYSGVYGTELTCEIFIGPVYYQRLRHMVSDKFQVRSTGTIDQVTRQPIKGRKRGGGIRFGEMERDSLLAHGAAYLLHDRLHTCSDYHIADVCSLCGSMLTTTFIEPQKRPVRQIGGLPPGRTAKKVTCHACQTSRGMETVAMPYVFRYLAAELAAMNIKMTLKLTDGAEVGA